MTAQRLVRGSKARIIASLCAVVFIVGLLVLFQRSQTELDNANKNYKICFEQQEGLATQLKVIVDYKTRLEKSLQAEKAEHKQTRTELESRINDEKTKRDKTSKEANNRFQSLQQHYKLLQTKHDDLQEKYDKLQQQHTEETDKLQSKIKELEELVKQSKIVRDATIETLKSQGLQLRIDKEKLIEELNKSKADHNKWENEINHLTKMNHQLKRELEGNNDKNRDNYKDINKNPEETINAPQQTGDVDNNNLLTVTTTRKFAKQIEVATDVYEIRDNRGKSLGQQESHIPQIDTPNKEEHLDQQNAPNVVLQKPSSSSKSTTKSNAVSQANINNARPLLLPTMTPSNSNNNTSKFERSADFNLNSINVLPMPNNAIPHKKLPPGVVPVPVQELQKHDDSQPKNDKTDDKNNGIAEEINLALPNRYRNNIIESELANEINKEIKPEVKPANNHNLLHNEPEINMGGDINQQDNAAEVIDQPKNPIQDELMDVNPAAAQQMNDEKFHEFKQAAMDPVVQLLENKKMKKQHIDTLLRNANGENGAIRAPPGGAMYENEGDYDKDGQKEDLQIEEADPEGEEDDDVDDYDGHLAARQKEPAVRN